MRAPDDLVDEDERHERHAAADSLGQPFEGWTRAEVDRVLKSAERKDARLARPVPLLDDMLGYYRPASTWFVTPPSPMTAAMPGAPAAARHPLGGSLIHRARRLYIDSGQEAVVYLHRDSPLCRSEGFEAQSRIEVRRDGRLQGVPPDTVNRFLASLPAENQLTLVGDLVARLTGDIDTTTGLLQMALISPAISVLRLILAMGVLFARFYG